MKIRNLIASALMVGSFVILPLTPAMAWDHHDHGYYRSAPHYRTVHRDWYDWHARCWHHENGYWNGGIWIRL